MKLITAVSALAIVAGALTAAPGVSNAAFVDFYSAVALGSAQTIANGSVIGGIQLDGYSDGGSTYAPKLAQANIVGDRGIGVCSASDVSGPTSGGVCAGKPWSGDTDELDNLQSQETLKLTLQNGLKFTGTFGLSSLDDNGGKSDLEDGYVSWAGGSLGFNQNGTFSFGGDVGSASLSKPMNGITEDHTWLLTIGSASLLTVSEVTFSSGCANCGTDNDYLVSGADVSAVPLPAALPMFLAALTALGLIGRRHV